MANHLKNEHSPYLQQHAKDSVVWYPWGQEALQKARKEQKPIFLSIGYSSCHWCHTMSKESFNDAKTAAILNEHFIAIKVDQEERPDIDNYFQAIYKIMNGSVGGWPTSVFLSDTLKPFYTATYIPDEPKYAMMSFSSLLEVIAHKYKHEKATLLTEADRVLAQLHPKKESIQATKLDASIIDRYIKQAKGLFDNQEGGFSTAPKFPQTSTLELLLTLYTLTQDKEALSMAEQTLTAMAKGGLRDLVDGGFYRYTTDNAWREPHFEKMGYDNALLGALYLQAYHTTNHTFYKRIAFETIDFMLDKMGRDGLFYTASNVGSRAYALFSYDETLETFKNAEIPAKVHKALLKALHICKEGDVDGANVIRVDTPQTIEIPYYKEAIKALKTSRAKRDYPFIDKKILLSWNAMMTTTLFKASRIEPSYLDTALHALEKLLSTFYVNATLFHTTLEGEEPTVEAFFEDYAYLAQTLLEAHQSTLDEVFLITATQILNTAIEQYYENGRWRFTKGELETYTDINDSPYPSAVATLLDALHTLSSLVDPVYRKFIFKTLEFYSYDIMRQPISTPKMSQMVIRYLKDDTVIKAKEERLNTHIADLDSLPYPFTLLKGENNDGFTLSSHNGSLGYEEAFEGVVKALKKR